MEEFSPKLNNSPNITVHEAVAGGFFDCTTFLGAWYRNLKGLILSNHMFAFSQTDGLVVNKFKVSIRKNNIDQHQPIRFDIIRKLFPHGLRAMLYANTVATRPTLFARALYTSLESGEKVYLNLYKKIELYRNY